MERTPERRASPRVPVQCSVKYFYLPPSPNPPVTHMVNAGMGGACIEVPDPLILGSVIGFHVITSEHQVIDARARVIYVRPSPNPLSLVGVYFTHLSEHDRALLAREMECAKLRISLSEGNHGSLSDPLRDEAHDA